MTTPNGLWRNPLLLDKQVDQRLHGLHLLVRNKLVVLGDSHEVHKRHVKNVMFVDMPERVQPVGVVKMGVATEHLFHDTLAVLIESRREPTGLANPILPRSIRSGVRWSNTCGLIGSKGFWCVGNLFSGEHDGVMDLADDPFLHTVDEFGSRDLRSTAINEPRIGQTR